MATDKINLVIVGHVDHGKSTLIGRILYDTNSLPVGKVEEIKKTCSSLGRKFEFAYLVDALEEERKEERTIDTTQTFFKTKVRDYVIIDVPGHKEFLKNMITGATQADAAILIVDVTRGLEEQTKRHAFLLKLMGLEHIVVVINKMDIVDYEKEKFEEVRKEVVDYLGKIGMEVDSILPISAYFGDNVMKKGKLKWYRSFTLIEKLDSIKVERFRMRDLRVPIQDVYQVNNKKIFAGIVLSGIIREADTVTIFPSGKKRKVRELLVGFRRRKVARTLDNIGVRFSKNTGIKRGDVICKGSKPIITRKIEAVVFCLDSIQTNQNFSFHCMTQERKCKVKILKKFDLNTLKTRATRSLKAGEIGEVEISLSGKVVLENFYKLRELGRFVLKREGSIVAGGIYR